MATKKAAGKSAAKRKTSSKSQAKANMPDLVYANVSPRSIGGRSLYDAAGPVTAGDALSYVSEERVLRAAANQLQAAGFRVLGVSAQTINIAGSAAVYEEAFATTLVTEERPVIKGGAVQDTATFVDCPTTDLPGFIDVQGTAFSDVLEGVAIEEPVYFMAESAYPPPKSYWHLKVPGDIAAATGAERAHRRGYTGKGVKVVMVDSGWYRHPYFDRRGYRSSPVVLGPGTANPADDESGHGTGESANLFAVAPDIDFTMVKVNFTNSLGAFNAGVALNPDIISNSWGSSQQFSLTAANITTAAAVALAWSQGVVVVFSAGNGHWGFPGQHPDVISAGGVYMHEDESLEASTYSSGFASNIYSGRNVPDLSGLVGQSPKAAYIMLPVQPGDNIDSLVWNHPSGSGRRGGTHPNGDETGANDGWAAFSGTSAAAPQLAGVAALMKQACSSLSPNQIRSILQATAIDVTAGTNAHGNAAAVGYDVSTGSGLVDANKAVSSARLACLSVAITPGIVPGVVPGVIPGITPGVVPGVIPGITPGVVPGVIPGITPGVVPGVIPGIRPGINPGILPGIRPGINPGIRPGIRPGPRVDPAAAQMLQSQGEAIVNAGYSVEQADAWVQTQIASLDQNDPGENPSGITAEDIAAIEEAILGGDDFDGL